MSDDPEIEALVTDRYLDALLAAVDRHADDSPSGAGLDPDIREAARVLRASLVYLPALYLLLLLDGVSTSVVRALSP